MEGNKSVDVDVGICFLTWHLVCPPRHFISAFLWQTIVFSGKSFMITCHSVTLYQVYILSLSLVYSLILHRLMIHKLFEVAALPLFYFLSYHFLLYFLKVFCDLGVKYFLGVLSFLNELKNWELIIFWHPLIIRDIPGIAKPRQGITNLEEQLKGVSNSVEFRNST